jgi:hypothetical protein
MWPFKSKKTSEDTKPLRERIDDLERRCRRVEEEWTDVYGKFRTLQMRVAKQVQRLEENSSLEEPQPAGGDENGKPDGAGTSGVPMAFPSLSPRQQQIQREILERRAKKLGGG